MDDFCPSLAIQVSPNPTPAEIIIISVSKRNGIFQVSLGNGEGVFKVWSFCFSPVYNQGLDTGLIAVGALQSRFGSPDSSPGRGHCVL